MHTFSKRRYFLIILAGLILPVLLSGMAAAIPESILAVDRIAEKVPLTSFLEYYADPSGYLTLEDMQTPSFDKEFKKMTGHKPGFGYSHSSYWFRLRIVNKSKDPVSWYLEWEYPLTDIIDFHLPSADGYKTVTVGDALPFALRPFNYRTFIIPVKTEKGTHSIYMRVKTKGSLIVSLNAWAAEMFYPSKYGEFKTLWFFYGFMLAMISYNIVIFIWLRQRVYLFLSLFTISFSVYTMIHNGLAFQYLWPASPGWGNSSNPVIAFVASILALQFARTFLETKKEAPIPDRALKTLMITGGANILLMLFIDYYYASQLSTVQVTLSMIALLGTSLYLLKKGSREALFYILSWLFLFITIMLHIMRAFGIMERTILSVWGYYFGGSLMILLLSLGIADKLRTLITERERSQAELYTAQRLMAVQLEQKVLERTEELKKAHEQINMTYEEMKKDLQLARTIQMNILPDPVEVIGGLHFCVEYMPLIEIGGDIYDIHELDDGTVRILLADATGHGIVASLITMLIKSEYEPLKIESPDPRTIIYSLNEIFCTKYKSLEIFFTGLVIDINRSRNKLTYCSAGHMPQYLIMSKCITDIQRTGRAIGIINNIDCYERILDLEEKFKILLFTDGLIEEMNQKSTSFGDEKLRSIVTRHSERPVRNIIQEVLQQVFSSIHDENQWDDITIIGIE
ncbi:MAG: hypothetical protein CVV44_13740 [Spirochaetae bacterium HGW-Spirochaetae-1]|jgi:serine phosphatase RsbU (regulator of sigma subunit)|nr:MAG: hypothetical protein CVV44_13740 [Spirochaetae bacterium HGW-Spirochaetae-1]